FYTGLEKASCPPSAPGWRDQTIGNGGAGPVPRGGSFAEGWPTVAHWRLFDLKGCVAAVRDGEHNANGIIAR
ncbi:hypothetical protein NPIL_507761, partial [Nephila pilipes]